jgi:uncharacterized membrane protein
VLVSLKFLHVIGVIVWAGGTLFMTALTAWATRQSAETRTLFARATSAISGFVFGPASLATIIGGIALAVRGQYGNQLWIQWGMGAVLATIIVGVVFIRPVQNAAVRGAHRGGRLLALQSVNLAILISAVVVMIFKPTM